MRPPLYKEGAAIVLSASSHIGAGHIVEILKLANHFPVSELPISMFF